MSDICGIESCGGKKSNGKDAWNIEIEELRRMRDEGYAYKNENLAGGDVRHNGFDEDELKRKGKEKIGVGTSNGKRTIQIPRTPVQNTFLRNARGRGKCRNPRRVPPCNDDAFVDVTSSKTGRKRDIPDKEVIEIGLMNEDECVPNVVACRSFALSQPDSEMSSTFSNNCHVRSKKSRRGKAIGSADIGRSNDGCKNKKYQRSNNYM
ncbi:hypothetical protein ACH5RR_026000 [Cinchona calisaya]|uniref:Uncharacterized protein n=1 Tax=Cinchona calisaya TaxID=153742 RepID=A0ABD2Z196_9GENT